MARPGAAPVRGTPRARTCAHARTRRHHARRRVVSDAAAVLVTIVGAALVLLTLRDVFHTLFRPGGTGSASAALQRAVWRLLRRLAGRRPERLVVAGPLILVLVVATWAATLAVGFALVLWPRLPSDFRFASALAAGAETGIDTALYLSIVTLTTLGFGDVTPTQPGLRLLVVLEAALGFALLTAGISWVQAVYPVLSRRRSLAERVHALGAARRATGDRLVDLEPSVAAAQLVELASALATTNVDLVQTGITYCFTEVHERSALPRQLPFVLQVAEEGMARGDAPAVRHAAHQLRTVLTEYAWTVRTAHLRIGERPLAELLDAYARDHGHGADG